MGGFRAQNHGPLVALLVLVACSHLLVLAACSNRVETEHAVPPRGPSFVLVTIDTLRADHVGAYGSEAAETPTLDRLAGEGALFETALAVAPLTLPAHTSILTGLYPPRHGVRHNGIFRVSPATETVAQVLDRFPESFRMHDVAARAHLQLGDLDAALRHAQRGSELLPRHEAPWALLGAVHLTRGEPEAAREAYESAVARNPAAVNPRLGLVALLAREDPGAAQAHAAVLLSQGDPPPEVFEGVAAAWEKAGDDDRAFELYQRAVRVHPDVSRLRQLLGIQLARRGDDTGVAEQRAALPAGERDPHLELRLAVVYAARGEGLRAIGLLRGVVERDPANEGARRLLSRVERETFPAGRSADAKPPR
ncbi:MAG: hypothetical protein CL910_13525 [Deltaproteobacteria bacterium]|nr:hypothetical protein [Deltaproteobacteria bacterium]